MKLPIVCEYYIIPILCGIGVFFNLASLLVLYGRSLHLQHSLVVLFSFTLLTLMTLWTSSFGFTAWGGRLGWRIRLTTCKSDQPSSSSPMTTRLGGSKASSRQSNDETGGPRRYPRYRQGRRSAESEQVPLEMATIMAKPMDLPSIEH